MNGLESWFGLVRANGNHTVESVLDRAEETAGVVLALLLGTSLSFWHQAHTC